MIDMGISLLLFGYFFYGDFVNYILTVTGKANEGEDVSSIRDLTVLSEGDSL